MDGQFLPKDEAERLAETARIDEGDEARQMEDGDEEE